MTPTHDYHIHSTYSDGSFMGWMLHAAEQAGLDAVGFADHCNVSDREAARTQSYKTGFNLDLTYERRRQAINSYREDVDVRIFDAVEMDYDPRDEARIADFLDEAEFDYAVGSVHHLEDVNVHIESYFAQKSEGERRDLVDEYFDNLVALIDSELFEIAAHIDLVERNPALRGYATDAHYEAVAAALAESETVPEINAGRALSDYGQYHPTPRFLDILREYDVSFTVGSDSHEPTELVDRIVAFEDLLDRQGIDPVQIVDAA